MTNTNARMAISSHPNKVIWISMLETPTIPIVSSHNPSLVLPFVLSIITKERRNLPIRLSASRFKSYKL
jgi:hypothetical protein